MRNPSHTGGPFLRWEDLHLILLREKPTNSLYRNHEGARYTLYFELIHDQLPLAVPCYDFVLVTKLTLSPHKVEFRALSAPLT